MADVEYDYTVSSSLAINTLTQQIVSSNIATSLDYMNLYDTSLAIFFTSTLSGPDQTTLNNLVSAASNTALPEDFIEVTSTTSTNTNSSSYGTLDSMTYSLFRKGNFLIEFTGTFSTTVPLFSNPGLSISVFCNGTQISSSEMSQTNLSANSPFNMVTSGRVTTTADYQTIEIKWKTNGSGNTISCTTRVLDITRL